MKKLFLFVCLCFTATFAKAGWFDQDIDQYVVKYTTAPMGVSASTTVVLVALSSNTWPHPTDARAIIVDSIQIDNDKTAATTSIVKIGVIREINVSSGTIVWFERQGEGINVSNTNVYRKEDFVLGMNCRVDSIPPPTGFGPNIGRTPYILSNDTLQSTAITTGLPLANPAVAGFNYFPRVGDIVMNVVNSAVVANLSVRIRYHIETK